jgi:hypothetical protein
VIVADERPLLPDGGAGVFRDDHANLKEVTMTIENSDLNTSGALKSSNDGLTGGTGDGNDPSVADLARGFSAVTAPQAAPTWLPQNANDGENYVGDPYDRGGFAGRPMGRER